MATTSELACVDFLISIKYKWDSFDEWVFKKHFIKIMSRLNLKYS